MTSTPEQNLVQRYEESLVDTFKNFDDPGQEWRRLFSELLGTFFLVLVAAGGGMMGQAFPDTISRTAAVVAPGLMVMAIILFMGKVSGAHLNPAVSLAFSLRGDFPWKRVPGYIVVQLVGATLACLFLRAVIDVSATYGSNYPAPTFSASRRVPDGGRAHARARQRHPRNRVGRAEHRRLRRHRRRCLHRPRRPLGQPHLRRLDEPGPHVRARPRRQATSATTGFTWRARSWERSSRSERPGCCAAPAAAGQARVRRRATSTPR